MRIIGIQYRVWDDDRELVDVHEETPQILPRHCRHVDYVSAISEYP